MQLLTYEKPKVEFSAAGERWILARLRKLHFTSVAEVNAAVRPCCNGTTPARISKAAGSRAPVCLPKSTLRPDGLARVALAVVGVQNGARAYRQPCRVEGHRLQRCITPW
ncbi:MAG: hypothetical protein IPH35_26560 [Rhodoferax sp.]|nr:hypothetical protein [Rhodoferax sp.]